MVRRLISKGLMFGNLIHIESPALVERYRRALQHLTGKTTALEDFHVDLSGYSPEIGAELGDEYYLNHAGVNRQFILLTTEQKTAPLLNAMFSTSRSIFRDWIEANEAQLFALTARDAVAGELVNSVYDVSEPKRLLDIRQITVEADTTDGTVANAGALGRKINQFKQEPDAWFDDVLIAEMIDLAKKTGDVIRNPVKLKVTKFTQSNFWTAHFGGCYVFQDLDHPAAIVPSGVDLPMEFTFTFEQRNKIAYFLQLNELVEPIAQARGIDAAAVLKQKMDFIVVAHAAKMGEDLKGASRRDLRALARAHAGELPEAFEGLAALARWAESGGPWPKITAEHPAYFYTLRAKPHHDADLVNRLLAQLAPLDVRQLFICHKELFYETYRGWTDAKKEYVADFLAREYLADKDAARHALFGHDAPMEEPQMTKEDIIDLVGPWGAVRRG